MAACGRVVLGGAWRSFALGLAGLAIAGVMPTAWAATFTVTNTNDAGPGSLRNAIEGSNQMVAVADTIVFSIPGSGPHVIRPTTALPTVAGKTLIDGYTQPGASPNTEATGNNAVLRIVLDGSRLGADGVGLTIAAGESKVRGLVINGFGNAGIELKGIGLIAIEGNFIGTNADGTVAVANGIGISVAGGSSVNTIGGSMPDARNLIAGNKRGGIEIAGASGTRIEGNYIGTDKTAIARLANENGIVLKAARDTSIGGVDAGQGNVISGNSTCGVFSADGTGLVVVGNRIGTDAAGTKALGNSFGIYLRDERDGVIGRASANAGNVIAFNRKSGAMIVGYDAVGNAIRGNSIHGNGELGINLHDLGVTPNDPAPDADKGANRLQNFPELLAVEASGAGIKVSGVLRSAPNTPFHVDFYGNAVGDPSGHGEGKFFLGTVDVTTDGKGEAAFEAALPASQGPWISATATRGGEFPDTSEFSPLVALPGTEYGVNNTNPSGPGSFAQAILDSNASGNPGAVNRIVFNIPGAGSHVTTPANVMTVTRAVEINGCTQPGATPGNPAIGVDGVAVNGPVLNITGDNVTVRCIAWLRHQPATNIGAVQVTGHGNRLSGNLFGITPGGAPIPNKFGIAIFGEDNLIGGATPADGNVISGNTIAGVAVAAGAVRTLVRNNMIGTDASGTQNRGNGDTGITIAGGEQTRVSDNVIAFNVIRGMSVSGTGTGNTISRNSMFGNGLGIDIAPSGPNANDPGDADGGANEGQNHPELGSATIVGSVTVAGTMSSTPDTEFRVEFFLSPACNSTGFGEGRTFLGESVVVTDATGAGAYSVTLPDTVVAGQFLTATATGPSGSTSEFSRCVAIAGGAPPAGTVVALLAPKDAAAIVGTTHTVTVTVTSGGAPTANVPVEFTVTSGPAAGRSGTATTGGDGLASFGYANDGTGGTEAIAVTGTANGVQFAASGTMTWAATGSAEVVEFYHAGLDHYFITWLPAEIAILDAGETIKGWARTGYGFRTHTTAHAGTSPVCRVYIPPELGNSHFFGRGTAECTATVQQNPSFEVEDLQFMQMFLPVAGACPAGTTQVHRVFSNRQDANHRYMTDKAVRAQMVTQGWLAEGDGADMVVMCAPQ